VFGKRVHWWVEILITFKTLLACLIFEIILGDLMRDLAAMVGYPDHRSILLVLLALIVLVPLALLRSFAALAPVAALGTFGTLYTAAFMLYRYTQGAYLPDGFLYADATYKPSFDEMGTRGLPIFVLVSMFGTAYIVHFNAPKFANQLENPTASRFGVVSFLALIAAITATAVVLDDLFVVAVIGSVVACSIIYVLPALALMGTFEPILLSGKATAAQKMEYRANQAIFVLGILMAIIGIVVTLSSRSPYTRIWRRSLRKRPFLASPPATPIEGKC